MEKLVIFSSGFPLALLPSTLAEPAALVKMRTISHRKPGPWGLSFLFQEQCLNSSQPPRAARGWGAGPVKAIWAPGTFKMMQGAAVWRAASLGKAQPCPCLHSLLYYLPNLLDISTLPHPVLGYR